MAIGTSTNQYFEDTFSANHADFLSSPKSESYPSSGAPLETNVRPSQGQGKASNEGTRPITIIRHGATKLNNDDVSVDRIRGWNNIPLSKEGKEEAEKLGEKLKKEDAPDLLLTSDLHRASETAHIVSQKAGIPVKEETQGFRPWNVGELAGQVSKHAVPLLADYATKKPDEKVPGGESFNDFKGRFMGALKDAMEKYPDQHLGIVTHHRGERLLKAWEAKGFPEDGTIDHDTFTQKGDHTGAAIKMDVPQSKVEAA